jgi:hypothetical protein
MAAARPLFKRVPCRYSGAMSSPRGPIRALLALLLAYALAFAPALAQAARGQAAAMPDAMGALCLTQPDGSPAHQPGDGRGASHEDCCLSGCRSSPAADAAAPGAELPARIARMVSASEPLPRSQGAGPLRCETPPATGPPAWF